MGKWYFIFQDDHCPSQWHPLTNTVLTPWKKSLKNQGVHNTLDNSRTSHFNTYNTSRTLENFSNTAQNGFWTLKNFSYQHLQKRAKNRGVIINSYEVTRFFLRNSGLVGKHNDLLKWLNRVGVKAKGIISKIWRILVWDWPFFLHAKEPGIIRTHTARYGFHHQMNFWFQFNRGWCLVDHLLLQTDEEIQGKTSYTDLY